LPEQLRGGLSRAARTQAANRAISAGFALKATGSEN